MSPVTGARPVDQGRLQGLNLTRFNWTGMATLWLQTLGTRVRVDAIQVGPVLGSGFDTETVFRLFDFRTAAGQAYSELTG